MRHASAASFWASSRLARAGASSMGGTVCTVWAQTGHASPVMQMASQGHGAMCVLRLGEQPDRLDRDRPRHARKRRGPRSTAFQLGGDFLRRYADPLVPAAGNLERRPLFTCAAKLSREIPASLARLEFERIERCRPPDARSSRATSPDAWVKALGLRTRRSACLAVTSSRLAAWLRASARHSTASASRCCSRPSSARSVSARCEAVPRPTTHAGRRLAWPGRVSRIARGDQASLCKACACRARPGAWFSGPARAARVPR